MSKSGSNMLYSMLAFHKGKHRFEKLKFPGNIANIYVIIFGSSLHFWCLVYRWNI